MRVYWKALLGYGFVFWILLCITDFLGITNVHKYSQNLDDLYEKPVVVKNIEQQLEPHLHKLEYKGIKFGWSLLVWNTLTFIFSILVCSIGKSVSWIVWGFYRCYRNRITFSQIRSSSSQFERSVSNLSKIPIMIRSPITRSSDSILDEPEGKPRIEADKSCPNLMKRSESSLSNLTTKTCKTLYRKDSFYNDSGLSAQQLEKHCKKLRDELHKLQTNSLKEHAVLSRKLEAISKEKKEIIKQLTVAQKENRAAKQQLEELLQEKSSLLKKLENATKEFKCNTKTKKFALAKLEEVTSNVDELRQQLEQVTRDKEILEKKLRLLENEYNKLHDRYISSQRIDFPFSFNNENMPERDENNEKIRTSNLDNFSALNCVDIPSEIQQTADVLASVSQTELDMKMIQQKIKQLEKNLENLNTGNNEFGCSQSGHQLESDISLSINENTTDSQNRIDEETVSCNESGFSGSNSPRQKYWSGKVAELIGKNTHQFAKIQALASQMQEKARYLGNIRERSETAVDEETSDELSSDEREPRRIVSSSIAFKNFLKSLNTLDATKRQLTTYNEAYF